MISLATNIASNFRRVEKMDDPVLSQWKGHELKNFNVDMRQVISAVARMG
jgi:hypothetical protein